jgi:hypothetical protein
MPTLSNFNQTTSPYMSLSGALTTGGDTSNQRTRDLFSLTGITGFVGNSHTITALRLARDGQTAGSGYAFTFSPSDAMTSTGAIADYSAVELDLMNNFSLTLSEVRDLVMQETLDEAERIVLGDRRSYTALIWRAIYLAGGANGVPASSAVLFHLMQLVGDAINRYIAEVTIAYFASQNMVVQPSMQSAVESRLQTQGINVMDPYSSVAAAYQLLRQLGNLPQLVNAFFHKGEIRSDRVNDAIKAEMVNYLQTLNLNTDNISYVPHPTLAGEIELTTGDYDEYFAAAYQHALRVSSGQEDPIFQVYNPNYTSQWNLDVDYFEDVEEQAIMPEHIRAAGALYYCYILGEVMGLYHVVDHLTLMWARGSLALSQGEASTKLYRYYKRRDDRMTPEERGVTWKQVLNLGDGPVLQNMVINTEFTTLMDSLLREVVEFMAKTESFDSGSGNVSSESIYISMHGLQGNLSSYMVGKPLSDVHELYAQLKDCLDILKSEEILDQIGGGRRKSIWTGAAKVLREQMGRNINVSAAKTAAVEVHKIFDFISRFEYSRRHYTSLSTFIRSTEAFILAQEQIEGSGTGYQGAGSNGSLAAPSSQAGDDFDDWD